MRSSMLLASSMMAGPALLASGASRPLLASNPHVLERNPIRPEEIPLLKARLLANENPYGPSKLAREAIVQAIGKGNRYGHQEAHHLMELIAEKEGVSKEHIMLGPGSTDLLEKTAIVCCIKGGNVVSAHPSYMSLINTAKSIGADWRSVHLKADYAHDLAGMKQAIDEQTRLVYICNPNNPTGTLTPAKEVEAFCAAVADRVPVFVDEAYLEFLGDDMSDSMVRMVQAGKDVIVSRTFSKIHAMAGLRIGYLVAQPERLEKIRSMVRGTMGLCITSIMGATASLKDVEFQQSSRELNASCRTYVSEALEEMDISYIPSHTSFVIFPIEMPTDQFQQKMLDEGVGIRVYDIDDKPWCRVSMGTREELGLFLGALKKIRS